MTLVYGPIVAFLVELFPTRIRYTSTSLPCHIGDDGFGGMLPVLATGMAAAGGDIYYGLWYPIFLAIMTCIVGLLFLHGNTDGDIESSWQYQRGNLTLCRHSDLTRVFAGPLFLARHLQIATRNAAIFGRGLKGNRCAAHFATG